MRLSLTSVLDLAGAVLLILGLVLFVAQWSLPAALAAGGAAVLFLSWLVDRPSKPRTGRQR